jgi:hypothetical protein
LLDQQIGWLVTAIGSGWQSAIALELLLAYQNDNFVLLLSH